MDVLVARHDCRACARATEGRRGGHHPRRPIRCRARGRECPCGRGLSVAVLRHPQRWARVTSVDRRRWCPAWACGCRSSRPGSARSRPRAGSPPRGAGSRSTSLRKIDTALALMDTHVDTTDLLAQLAIPIPTVVTPQMFTYQLLDWARSDRKHIVLPEGDDDRILTAAGRLLQRGRGRPDDPRRGSPGSLLAQPNWASTCRRPRCSTRGPASCATSSPISTPSYESTRVSPSSRPAKSSTTSRTSAPCWCTTTWWTAWCRARGTPPRTPSGLRSRSSRRCPTSLQCRASS